MTGGSLALFVMIEWFDWTLASSVLALLEDWETNLPALRRAADAASFDEGVPMADLRVHAPVDLPRQLFFTGANYRKHVVDLTIDQNVGPEGSERRRTPPWAEQMMDERAANGVPYSFLKAPSSIIGAFDDLVLPPTTTKPDWELELGVVIGRGGRNIHRSRAMDHVAGYAIVNDVSARDLVPRTDYAMLGTDWLRGQVPARLLSLWPAARTGGVRRRSARLADPADAQRTGDAGRVDRRHDLRHRPPDRVRLYATPSCGPAI